MEFCENTIEEIMDEIYKYYPEEMKTWINNMFSTDIQ